MRGLTGFGFALGSAAVAVGSMVAAANLIPGDLGQLVGLAAMFAMMFVTLRLKVRLDSVALATRSQPVREIVTACGPMPAKERPFQEKVLKHVFAALGARLKREAPLPSGTRVDGWFQHDSDDWYVTIKRGLSNQQRLCLQGEIEDILLHSPKRERDMWIVVVVGIDPDTSTLGQLDSLTEYTATRSVSGARHTERGLNIEVVPVALAA